MKSMYVRWESKFEPMFVEGFLLVEEYHFIGRVVDAWPVVREEDPHVALVYKTRAEADAVLNEFKKVAPCPDNHHGKFKRYCIYDMSKSLNQKKIAIRLMEVYDPVKKAHPDMYYEYDWAGEL